VFGPRPPLSAGSRVIGKRDVQSRERGASGEPALSEKCHCKTLPAWLPAWLKPQSFFPSGGAAVGSLQGIENDRNCLMQPGDRWLVKEVRVTVSSLGLCYSLHRGLRFKTLWGGRWA
jgi:hypothetical protein